MKAQPWGRLVAPHDFAPPAWACQQNHSILYCNRMAMWQDSRTARLVPRQHGNPVMPVPVTAYRYTETRR